MLRARQNLQMALRTTLTLQHQVVDERLQPRRIKRHPAAETSRTYRQRFRLSVNWLTTALYGRSTFIAHAPEHNTVCSPKHLDTTPRKSREFRSRLFVNDLAHAELLVMEKPHHGASNALTRTKRVCAVNGAPLTVTATVSTPSKVLVTVCVAAASTGQLARSVEVSTV